MSINIIRNPLDELAVIVENKTRPKFAKTFCSQCGGEFGPGDSGYSHCQDHATQKSRDLPVVSRASHYS